MWGVYIYIYIYMNYLTIKEWNNAICKNMDEPRDYHTKWSKIKKDKYHMISLSVGSKKKKGTKDLIYKTEIDYRYRIQAYSYQVGKGEVE